MLHLRSPSSGIQRISILCDYEQCYLSVMGWRPVHAHDSKACRQGDWARLHVVQCCKSHAYPQLNVCWQASLGVRVGRPRNRLEESGAATLFKLIHQSQQHRAVVALALQVDSHHALQEG